MPVPTVPAQPTVLDHFRGHLVSRGIVREPGDRASAAVLHPLFIEPRTGPPAPGDDLGGGSDDVAVLSCRRATPIAVGPYESWYWRPVVEVVYRVRDARLIDALEGLVRGEFEDRRAWSTDTGLSVIESSVWRETQLLGSDKRAFTYLAAFAFQLYSGRAPRG